MVEAKDSPSQAPQDNGAPVVVAVDFTPDSKAALIWAGHYADDVGAKLLVLHVVHDPAEAPGYYRQRDENLLRPMEEVAAEMMASFLESVSKEHGDIKALQDAESTLVKGIPATRILEFAKAHGARDIVMGSRGRTGLPHLLLGSKAERVVQLSPIPVTIVKAEAPDA